MGIEIREYIGDNPISKGEMKIQESQMLNRATILDDSIMVDIEAIHEYPFATRNHTRYMKEALIKSIPTWTEPYLKPLIMHHNDKDGKIIGRIHSVEYEQSNTFSGTGALVFTVNIPDKEGKEQVKDGRLMTTSIGITGSDVRCSICQQNIATEGECEHDRGVEYDGEICYWDIYEMSGKELSYVIVPSDMYSKNKKIYSPIGAKQITESVEGETVMSKKEHKKVSTAKIAEQEESTDTKEVAIDDVKEEIKDDIKKDTKKEEKEETPKIEEKEEDKEKMQDALDEVQQELQELKQQLQDSIDQLNKEKKVNESLEKELIELKKESRTQLEEELNSLRVTMNKTELTEEEITSRTDESLRDSIADIKEEMKIKATSIPKIENPSLSIEDNTNRKDEIKEEKNNELEDIDLTEELEKIFSGVINSRKL